MFLYQAIADYLSEQVFDEEAVSIIEKQTILHLACCIPDTDAETIHRFIKNSSSLVLCQNDYKGFTPLNSACLWYNLNAVILLLLDERDVGLSAFNLNQFIESQPNELEENTRDCLERMKSLIEKAKESREAFEITLGNLPVEVIKELPTECLLKLAEKGRLSKDLLTALTVEGVYVKDVFAKENVKYFPSNFRNKLCTFFLCMKEVNKHVGQKISNDKQYTGPLLKKRIDIKMFRSLMPQKIMYNELVHIKEKAEVTATFKK